MTARIIQTAAGKRFVRYRRESLELSEEQWGALQAITVRLKCKARGGSRTGKPSWRTLLRMIAEGALTVSTNSTSDHAGTNE